MRNQHLKNCRQYLAKQPKRTQQITTVLVVVLVAGIGTFFLVGSHAATPYVATTADSGSLANGATTQSCTGASDGNCVVFGGASSAGPTYYITQNGGGNGSSCSSPESAAWFNSGSSWGTGSGQIGPDVTVDICSNSTISTYLTFNGSGTSGKPITLYFEPGSTISMPYCPGPGAGSACINTAGNSYLTIDGGTTAGGGGSDGVIQATENGSQYGSDPLPDHVEPSFGIDANNCTNCTIENLTIANLYRHTDPNDQYAGMGGYNTSFDHTQVQGIAFSGSNVTIKDNTLHDIGWAIVSNWNVTNSLNSPSGTGGGDGNVRIEGNTIYNSDHGFASQANQAGGNIGPIYFNNNHAYNYSNWDTTYNGQNPPNHHDGLHCFTGSGGGGAAAHYNAFYIYDNNLNGDNGIDMSAPIFLEGTNDGSPCADSSSNFYIFNNNISVTNDIGGGLIGAASGIEHIYNNTMTGPDTSANNAEGIGGLCFNTNNPLTGENFQNNIMNTCNELISSDISSYASGSPNYNLYANGGNNAFICKGTFLGNTQFSSWQSCIGGDAQSSYTSNADLNADGSPQSDSPAINAGANLTSLCTGNLVLLCSDINGTARPTTGPWDIGAYQ